MLTYCMIHNNKYTEIKVVFSQIPDVCGAFEQRERDYYPDKSHLFFLFQGFSDTDH